MAKMTRYQAGMERLIAKESGEKLYKGKKCKHGHSGLRYTSNGACFECMALYSGSQYAKNHPNKRTYKVRAI